MQSEDKDLMGWGEVRNVVHTDVVPESFETTVVPSVDSQNATKSGSATRSAEPGQIMRWRLTVAMGGHSSS